MCIPALVCGQLITPFQVCEFQCFKRENLTSAEYSSEAGLACRDYCLKHAYVCYVSPMMLLNTALYFGVSITLLGKGNLLSL